MNKTAYDAGFKDGVTEALEADATPGIVEELWSKSSGSEGLINALGGQAAVEVLGLPHGTPVFIDGTLTEVVSDACDDYDRGYRDGAREQAKLTAEANAAE